MPLPDDLLLESFEVEVDEGRGEVVGVEAAALASEDVGSALDDEGVAADVPTVGEALAVRILASTPTLSTFHHVGVFVASASLLCASFTSPVSGLT
jgi:hypothetical protein